MRQSLVALLSLDPMELLRKFGTIGLFVIVFAESGLFFGFFLPGDSLLFTAGLLSYTGRLAPLPVLLIGCFLAAFLGDQVGYIFGRRVGPSIFNRPNSRLFKQEYVTHASDFFERNGSKTIVLARFVPVVRTFAPILAGVSRMHYRTFVIYNAVGAAIWGMGVTLLGYLLGRQIGPEKIDKYLLPIIAVVILLSLLPVALEFYKHKRGRTKATPAAAQDD